MNSLPRSITARQSLLVVEDDVVLNQLLVRQLRKAGYDVGSAHSWAQARSELQRTAPDLVLLDIHLPDSTDFGPLIEIVSTRPVVMLTAFGDVQQAVEAMRLGASDYLIKPVNLDELELVIRGAIDRSHLQTQKNWLADGYRTGQDSLLIGDSSHMQRLRQLIAEVAPTDVTVLIQGESGTGKELVAKAIHAGSHRHAEALVPLDCCTLQETLFESELFGHERGAFTGADRRKTGLIEAAARGTLFLDELGEAGPAVQAKLLRVIETGRFRRVGATNDLRADVRIIAATNRDLLARVSEGLFRNDLYYRLSTFTIEVPPLRDRSDDVPALARHFLERRSLARNPHPKMLAAEAIERLVAYPWPGNVRELRNVIERAVIVAANSPEIRSEHLLLHQSPFQQPAVAPDALNRAAVDIEKQDFLLIKGEPTLDAIEREYLGKLLLKYQGNRRRVADALGVSERTAYRMLERHGFRHANESDTSTPAN